MLLHPYLIALPLDPSAWWDLCCFGFSGMTLNMINTCFHIPTRLIYCRSPAGLQALLPSSYLSWHLYSAVFTFPPPCPLLQNIICILCRQNSRRISQFPHTLLWKQQNCKKPHIFLISNQDVDFQGERWWAKVVVDLDHPSCPPPNLFCFLLGIILSISSSLVQGSQWLPDKQLIFKISFCWCKRAFAVFPLQFFSLCSLLQLLRDTKSLLTRNL